MNSIHRFLVAVFSFCLLFTVVFIAPAPSQAESSEQMGDVSQLQGLLSIVYGDPLPNSQDPVVIRISLLDLNTGAELGNLSMGIGLAHTYMGQPVQVTVARLSTPSTSGGQPTYLVQDIMPIPAPEMSSPQLAGSQAFVNLLCKFPDIASEPRTPVQYAELFTNTYGSVRNFWETISYNAINFDGTVVASQWRNLPNNWSYYVPDEDTEDPDLGGILQHCVNAFDATTNFTPFIGINIMLNYDIGCCAWGGSSTVATAEGFKYVRVTWNPPGGQTAQIFAHETGHALGLPHSSGPHDSPPSGLNIYVSQWDVMSYGGRCSQSYLTWGCIPAGTIAYYLDRNQWIPANRKVNVPTGTETTITLRRTQLNTTTGYILATVPINDSTSRFYTVEVRDLSGYDVNVPAAAVIIHDVDLGRTGNTGPALVVDASDGNNNVNDAGAQWQVGETFSDVTNRISIRVVSKTGSDYTVEIKNKPSIFFTENELLAQLQAHATGGMDYYLVDVISGNAFIYATVAGETVLAQVTVVSNGGYLVRFNIVQMTDPTAPPPDRQEPGGGVIPVSSAQAQAVVNSHLLPNLNLALDALIATQVSNADVEEIFFNNAQVGVVIKE